MAARATTLGYLELTLHLLQWQDLCCGLVAMLIVAIPDLVIADVVVQLEADHGELRRVRHVTKMITSHSIDIAY